jgi:hypothetical protein
MVNVATLAAWEGLVPIVSLTGVIAWKPTTGEISIEYCAYVEALAFRSLNRFPFVRSGRTRIIILTVIVAAYCLLHATQCPPVPSAHIPSCRCLAAANSPPVDRTLFRK